MKDFVDSTAFNAEQGNRARKLFAAVVLAALDDAIAEDDLTFEHGGVTVVVDETSLGLLEGSEVDYKEDLGGSFFQITNPNATASCGCGSSFSI